MSGSSPHRPPDTPKRHDKTHARDPRVHQDFPGQRLRAHAHANWPQLHSVTVRYRGPFAYIDGTLADGEILPLMRLRYGGSAARWGFAIYSASNNGYTDSILPTGTFAGSPQDALDCACDLYLTHSSS